ncbi:hypothetical protein HFP72_19620 [Nocardiopsis sp. ARC36]
MLLTSTSGGAAVHLTTATHEPGTGREAVWDFHFDRDETTGTVTRYDRKALTEPCWAQTTLCGRQWAVMVGGDGGAVGRHGKVAFAPTCRRCLTLIDQHFPKPSPDPRLTLVAQVVADVVVDQRGFAEIHDVPGDQQEELRKAVRKLVRQRTGHQVRTHLFNGVLHIECQAIYDQRAEQYMREAADVMEAVFRGESPPQMNRDWVVSWAAWDAT